MANQITTDGTWTYSYDDSGNRTKKSLGSSAETWTYEYNHNNHLIELEQRTTDGGTLLVRIDYTYDVFGNRLSRTENDGTLTLVSTERYGYDGWKTVDGGYNFIGNENFDVYIDLDGSNDVVARRIFGNSVDNLQARITPDGMTDEVHWYRVDRQGSVRGLLDDSGVPIATLTYDGFGNTISNSNSSVTDRYSYTGRELDTTADHLLHVRDRVLSLDLGKFLTRDRLGFQAGDVNLTSYVENGFPNATDPSGALRQRSSVNPSAHLGIITEYIQRRTGNTNNTYIRREIIPTGIELRETPRLKAHLLYVEGINDLNAEELYLMHAMNDLYYSRLLNQEEILVNEKFEYIPRVIDMLISDTPDLFRPSSVADADKQIAKFRNTVNNASEDPTECNRLSAQEWQVGQV